MFPCICWSKNVVLKTKLYFKSSAAFTFKWQLKKHLLHEKDQLVVLANCFIASSLVIDGPG